MEPHSRIEFASTHWSLIDHLRDGDPADREKASADLARIYWPAVYGYLRRHGINRETAEETTQAFFVEVVLGRSLFEGAAPGKGHLRSFVLTALRNYRIDQSRRARVRGCISIDSARLAREERYVGGDNPRSASPAQAEREFDRQWAAAAVEEALRRCREHFESIGKARHWQLFEERVVTPSARFTAPPSLTEAAARLGWQSSADAAAAVQVVKKRFDVLLREVVGETADDAEEEYRRVLRELT